MDKIENSLETKYISMIIEGIKKTLWQVEAISGRNIRHNFLQDSIVSLLKEKNFDVMKEYKVNFNSNYRSKRRFGENRGKVNGLIDIYANFIKKKIDFIIFDFLRID